MNVLIDATCPKCSATLQFATSALVRCPHCGYSAFVASQSASVVAAAPIDPPSPSKRQSKGDRLFALRVHDVDAKIEAIEKPGFIAGAKDVLHVILAVLGVLIVIAAFTAPMEDGPAQGELDWAMWASIVIGGALIWPLAKTRIKRALRLRELRRKREGLIAAQQRE
ncbi:MAG: hypothetical protein JNM10_18875 [Planctomycetia bacterium]|nr:hypothetical protein [Planctomycetia bacterium]